MTRTLSLSADTGANQLFHQLCDFNDEMREISNYNDRVNVIDKGDWFISLLQNYIYYCAYYHPSKEHSDTVEEGILPWDKTNTKSTSNGGEWVIACGQNRWSGGNKTYYNAW
jgi:hypothetical protein